ncbi:MAG: hypothetical protein SGPRY_013511 [Prymnesium sp.]
MAAEREAALAEERKKQEEQARQSAQQATLNKAATVSTCPMERVCTVEIDQTERLLRGRNGGGEYTMRKAT